MAFVFSLSLPKHRIPLAILDFHTHTASLTLLSAAQPAAGPESLLSQSLSRITPHQHHGPLSPAEAPTSCSRLGQSSGKLNGGR